MRELQPVTQQLVKEVGEGQRRVEEITASQSGVPFEIMYPGGNTTAIIRGKVAWDDSRTLFNRVLSQGFEGVEQVGCVYIDEEGNLCGDMMGGEFCGNFTRAAAWLALGGKPGEVSIRISGVNRPLKAGVYENGEAFAEMPIRVEPDAITQIDENSFVVRMEGITHVVTFDTQEISGRPEEEIKTIASAKLKALGLDSENAAGVIYATIGDEGRVEMVPIVQVNGNGVQTQYYETACGSGTAALGQVLAMQKGESVENVAVKQPSGMSINVSVAYDGAQFGYAEISGPTEWIGGGTCETAERNYLIEQVFNDQRMEMLMKKSNLIALYQQVFGEPPYNEVFTDDEVREILMNYFNNGLLLVAKEGSEVIGFCSVVYLRDEPDVLACVQEWRFDADNTAYIAELGVKPSSRRNGIGETLVARLFDSLPPTKKALVRTASNNTRAIALYEKMGFTILEGLKMAITQARSSGETEVDSRIFLAKEK